MKTDNTHMEGVNAPSTTETNTVDKIKLTFVNGHTEEMPDDYLIIKVLDNLKAQTNKSNWHKIKIKALEIYLHACKYMNKEKYANEKYNALVDEFKNIRRT